MTDEEKLGQQLAEIRRLGEELKENYAGQPMLIDVLLVAVSVYQQIINNLELTLKRLESDLESKTKALRHMEAEREYWYKETQRLSEIQSKR